MPVRRDATEGLVVAGRAATWEATRPAVLPAGESVKQRGFIDYRRHACFACSVHTQCLASCTHAQATQMLPGDALCM